jgi:hypothetical protein
LDAEKEAQGEKKWFPPARIHQLRTEREGLRQTISLLPQHKPEPLTGRLGYHSVLSREVVKSTDEFLTIEILFSFYSRLDSIAMRPVLLNGTSGVETYAFPERFRIEVLEARGRWIETLGDQEGRALGRESCLSRVD